MYQLDHYNKIKKTKGKLVTLVFITLDYLERETSFCRAGVIKEYKDELPLSPVLLFKPENGDEFLLNVNGCNIPNDPEEEKEENKCFNLLLELYDNDPNSRENYGVLLYSRESMENDSMQYE